MAIYFLSQELEHHHHVICPDFNPYNRFIAKTELLFSPVAFDRQTQSLLH